MWKCLNSQCPDRAFVATQETCYTCGNWYARVTVAPVLKEEAVVVPVVESVVEGVNAITLDAFHRDPPVDVGTLTRTNIETVINHYGGSLRNVVITGVGAVTISATFIKDPKGRAWAKQCAEFIYLNRTVGTTIATDWYYA